MTTPVQPGEKIFPKMTADWFNNTIPKTEVDRQGKKVKKKNRLVLVVTDEAISPAEISDTDPEATVYYAGLVTCYSLLETSTNVFSPRATTTKRRMINPSQETIPSGIEVWAEESESGFYVASVWVC